VIVKVRRDHAHVEVRGSLFCEVREASPRPLCGFYASALTRLFSQFGVPAEANIEACRAARGEQGCRMSAVLRETPAGEPAAA
jgi:hypothetical protein